MSSISLWHNLLLSLQIQQFNILLPFTDIYLPLYGSLNYAIIVTFLGTKVMGTAFRTTDRYSGLEVQGCGSAGTIWPLGSTALAKRTCREVHLLQNLRYDNLINMTEIFISPSEDLYENYYAKVERNANILCYSYIMTGYMMTDLHLLGASLKPLEC
ncbi:hypothetical protein N7497_012296 [Penicillium chrysogenum]|nr:hypothetical protein N7497_012296 [Penicillium chrysogenum]